MTIMPGCTIILTHGNDTPLHGIITYVGRYGFTVRTTYGQVIPISTTHSDQHFNYTTQYPLNSFTNKPYTETEVRKLWPEYFI